MTQKTNESAIEPELKRVIRGIPPASTESSRQYLRRIAAYWEYGNPLLLLRLAQAGYRDLDREELVSRFAHMLRITEEEWIAIAYVRAHNEEGPGPIRFGGQWIRDSQFAFAHPRICVRCMKEHGTENRLWELILFTCCTEHDCVLIDSCPKCREQIPRDRGMVCLCSCGFDLRNSEPIPASPSSVALSALIEYLVINGGAPRPDSPSARFPRELSGLALEDFLDLVNLLGCPYFDDQIYFHSVPSVRSGLSNSIQVVRQAAEVLSDWPRNLFRFMKHGIDEFFARNYRVSMRSVFGEFHRQIMKDFCAPQFSFLHQAFQQFIHENWKGPRCDMLFFSTPKTLEKCGWISAERAMESEHIVHPGRLVGEGAVEGFFVGSEPKNRGKRWSSRRGCWLRKESLRKWQLEHSMYIGLSDLQSTLGFPRTTIQKLAKAGFLQESTGQEGKQFYLRAEAERLIEAFDRHAVSFWDSWNEGVFLTFHEAMHTFLMHSFNLIAVLNAVLSGRLCPVGRTQRYSGLPGYVFSIREMLVIRHECAVGIGSEYLNPTDIARLGLMTYSKALALINAGILNSIRSTVTGNQELLVPLSDLESFCAEFVSTESLARSLAMSSNYLLEQLRERKTELLSVPMGQGRLRGRFVPVYAAEAFAASHLGQGERVNPTPTNWNLRLSAGEVQCG